MDKDKERHHLSELALWESPDDLQEMALLAEVEKLPRQFIHKASKEEMAYGRMKPRECHENCLAYASLDPTKSTKVVTGWWCLADQYTLHSVIETAKGELVCITPHTIPVPLMPFAPDRKFTWEIKGDYYVPHRDEKPFLRNGKIFPKLLRADPVKLRALAREIKAKMAAGSSLEEALADTRVVMVQE